MASREFILHRTWARQATIGFLGATTPSIWSAFVAAFEQRLRELDWINGGNIAIDYRWAEGRQDRYARLAQDFVRSNVDIIHIRNCASYGGKESNIGDPDRLCGGRGSGAYQVSC